MGAAPFLFEQLALYGPWLIFVMAILETSFVTGLVVPSGLTTSAATVMALEGSMNLQAVVLAAVAGGFVGDSIGFWIGSLGGERLLQGDGRWARILRERHAEMDEVFGRHPVISVTVARLISFVRTIMPMAAGMSEMTYTRFLPYEIVGLVLWAAIYVSIGVAGREGWEAATQFFGVGGTIVFAALAFGLVAFVRRRRRAVRSNGPGKLDVPPGPVE